MFNFVNLSKYKRQMTGNKLCVNLLQGTFRTPANRGEIWKNTLVSDHNRVRNYPHQMKH